MSKLFLIGIGLNDSKDITLKGLEAIKSCSKVYLEGYTSLLQVSKEDLENDWKVSIEVVDRNFVEKELEKEFPLKESVALLVVGDPFSATTHSSLILAAKENNQTIEIIHNASILNAVGETGLELYKFGRTVSLPYPVNDVLPMSSFKKIIENSKIGLHTLVLLDIKMEEKKFMSIPEAIDLLFGMGMSKNTLGIGIARIGSSNQVIKSGKLSELEKIDFGTAPHSLIIPSEMHFVEEDMIKLFNINK